VNSETLVTSNQQIKQDDNKDRKNWRFLYCMLSMRVQEDRMTSGLQIYLYNVQSVIIYEYSHT